MALWQPAFSFIELANRTDRADELASLFQESVKRFGFDNMVIGALTNPKQYGSDDPALLNTFSEQWSEHYAKSDYYKIDPVVRNVATHTMPFLWSKMTLESRQQKVILQEAGEMGMTD